MFIPFKTIRLVVISICMFLVSVVTLQAEEKKSGTAVPGMQEMTPAMQKSMDPNVWSNMMAMMMNPEKAMSMESCAQCHDAETVARYAKDFGPMMEAMKPMMSMMNPHQMSSMMNPNAYMGMMGPMMNPAMYMNMMGPMMGMMNPMMGMMNPMMGMGGNMMNPMGMMGPMMNPAMYMNMMYPMMGMMGPMMGGMGGMGGMPMMGGHGANPMGQMPGGQMMDPKQYEQWFSQWTEMMKNVAPQAQPQQ